ncbi:hypothetical protein EF847_08250 [Actinobacteria bacterium YIM 96077]|uniref:ATP synthase F0 subunit B n=1 Tax=Phytoactinopolyspora halophila TaxID=1981511 RepID=A0A329QJF1_9ACTN|nr:hypothetical protein [Phytoactinopolyspora halophila]AYY12704.1 hypothetical protein EF847_08250 [Actinobacteria bacterium YIM 96077]RAW10618.1 hypothetical protein DPM12_18955 [Phytoactinopolyspora halophila]
MEIHRKLDELTDMVESARTMPMSSSAIINKTEILAMISQVRDMLPESLAAADTVIAQREELLEEARANASKIINDAKIEQATLVGDHTILVEARRERGRTLEKMRQEIEAMRAALDDHVDAKLANVEVVASRIVDTVREGRDQLRQSSPYQELAAGAGLMDDGDLPDELSGGFPGDYPGGFPDEGEPASAGDSSDDAAELAQPKPSSNLDDGLPPRS